MNLLMLLSKDIVIDQESLYIREVDNKIFIEKSLENYNNFENKLIVTILEKQINEDKLDKIINIVNPNAQIITVNQQTDGAVCTALFVTNMINTKEELLIVNGNQFIDINITNVLSLFRKYDAGLLSFESLNPRYSFVDIDDSGFALELSEKNPISRNALCGFYYFKHGEDFIESANSILKKNTKVDGNFYISSVYNEMLLLNKKIKVIHCDKEKYYFISDKEDFNRFKKLF